ncbi:hypothetical protein [Clostridium botulinum]|uniref:hypothetical protein n=1 Tax=Clostridium botulinum TaxID=1491 RepID=UPI001C9A4FF0|nr:hypothetical protein [Clostridium botulinum]MBY6838633.1 hypothetical protein [Clostridium botulinum]
MLTNKDIEIINICLKTTLAITRGHTEGAKKSRKEIQQTILNFNEYINDIEDERTDD